MLSRIAEYCSADYRSRGEFILDALSSLGLDPIRQPVSFKEHEFLNIGAQYRGNRSVSSHAFSAHYDKTPEGQGMLDNGAAVVEILSALEQIVESNDPQPLGVLFFDGEEIGLLGSRNYARDPFLDAPNIYNLEVTGRGDSVLMGTHSYDSLWKTYSTNSRDMNEKIEETCRGLQIPAFHARTPPSDNVMLNKFGFNSTVFSTVSRELGEFWSQTGRPTADILDRLCINGKEDTLDKIEPDTLHMVRRILLGIHKQEPLY